MVKVDILDTADIVYDDVEFDAEIAEDNDKIDCTVDDNVDTEAEVFVKVSVEAIVFVVTNVGFKLEGEDE